MALMAVWYRSRSNFCIPLLVLPLASCWGLSGGGVDIQRNFLCTRVTFCSFLPRRADFSIGEGDCVYRELGKRLF